MIYFIRDTASGHVKIGFSENPWLRMVKMQADCPGDLEIVGLLDGDRAVESGFHGQFAPQRIRGEWFRAEGALSDFLATLERPDAIKSARRAIPKTRLIHRLATATGARFNTAAGWVDRGNVPAGYLSCCVRAGIATADEFASASDAHFGRRKMPHAEIFARAMGEGV